MEQRNLHHKILNEAGQLTNKSSKEGTTTSGWLTNTQAAKNGKAHTYYECNVLVLTNTYVS